MSDWNEKHPKNVPGRFSVGCNCLDHDFCIQVAPANFARDETTASYYVCKQPENPTELAQCMEALDGCPVEAITCDG